jgi:signal transduction histidine kinase
VYFFWTGERKRELQQFLVRQQIGEAEKAALENKLHREELERKHQEVERKLLEQRIATQEAEQQALELKSKLYASIGVMAGSYAHNIKNLLVRPNDLLRRCLEANGVSADQKHMLGEVQSTLGTVTERLHEILKTVRRDPTRSDKSRFDLNELVAEIAQTWQDMARDKWKLNLTAELAREPLLVEADRSHLMQAIENLLFNARDATFEMRNLVREEARANQKLDAESKKSALIAAASWRGAITLRTSRQNGRVVLEVSDNGIGMTEEVRRRCTETHFSTKRDNALYEGNTTGMGLGLSFVQTILDHHQADIEIDSAPREGATFRVRLKGA